jgi:hypothetical protein
MESGESTSRRGNTDARTSESLALDVVRDSKAKRPREAGVSVPVLSPGAMRGGAIRASP